jgi:hypothetical protein
VFRIGSQLAAFWVGYGGKRELLRAMKMSDLDEMMGAAYGWVTG